MSDGRIPILHLAPWVDLGGADRGTIDWFRHIDRTRWAPSLITTSPSANRWLHHVEPFAEEIWDLPDLMPGAAFPEFILGFIESRGVKLVHVMNARLGFDLLPDVTCLPEPPAVVVQLHSEEPERKGYVRYVTRRYGNLIDAFSVASRSLKETVVAYDIPPSRVEPIYLGVDAEVEFDPARVEPFELDGGRKRVLWPGRLVPDKDPLLTVEVLARARDRGADFVLDVVGEGHLEEPTRARAQELGVGGMIEWHPPSQEMPRWFRSADLLLMTSLFEGMPLVIYEALAMGVPVVAPALPGNMELMDARSGVLVEPRDDADRYAEAIVSLLADDERRRKMGKHSRRRMLDEFSLAEMGRRHDALYERLLSKRTASSRWRDTERAGVDDPVRRESQEAPPTRLRLPRDPPPEPTVGAVVPCHRHGIFLDACIASIRSQTVAPAQIVVVDDASEDSETVEALARLDDDPDVAVLRQPRNLGPSAARNRGVAALRTSYFLPLDADDELLPDAIERMLAQLERAPEHVGFVYPVAQHVGNRSDRFEPPAYNLWLLMEQNFCASPALFDRRLFEDTGIAYPKEIVIGHEDWDLVLQLAESDVGGIPADGPTFLYRKQGFSRVHAVDYGPASFEPVIQGRHPGLYRNRPALKARWAPALSILLLDEDGAAWAKEDLAGLAGQRCRDFELLAGAELGDGVLALGGCGDSAAAWLQEAIDAARGRWLLLLPRSAAAALGDSALVEKLIRAFSANAGTAGIVLATSSLGSSRAPFSQLDDFERLAAEPAAVALARPLWGRAAGVALGAESSPLGDIAVGLTAMGSVQWRLAPAASPPGAPWGESLDSRSDGASLDVNLPAARDPVSRMRQMTAHQEPLLPGVARARPRRWARSEPWTPPDTRLLCRHVDTQTGLRTITAEREPPSRRHRLECVLGSTHRFAAPGMRRLVHAEHGYALSDEQGALPEGHHDLGYVEQQPLPQLQELELRRVPQTGQLVLVAGADDPLLYASERIDALGWLEPCPLLPRAEDVIHAGPWSATFLRRRVDRRAWRHRYLTGSIEEPSAGVLLGGLLCNPGPGRVALRLRRDGRLVSALCAPGRASRDPRKIGGWLAEPLRAPAGRGARLAGSASRLRHLGLRIRGGRPVEEDGVVLGFLLEQAASGTSTLYSTIHPVTGDQLVTRSPEEAAAAGYVMDGILGAIFDPPASTATPPEEMPWARVSRGLKPPQ